MKENTHSKGVFYVVYNSSISIGRSRQFLRGAEQSSQIYSRLNRAVIAKKEIRCVVFFYVLQCLQRGIGYCQMGTLIEVTCLKYVIHIAQTHAHRYIGCRVLVL